jgi:hypothetical protein
MWPVLQLRVLLDTEQKEAASIAAESAAIKGRIEGLSQRANLLSSDLERSCGAVSTAREAALAAEHRAADLGSRLAVADSAAEQHSRMHAHLVEVNRGLAREAQELHEGLTRLRQECAGHAATVEALEVARSRLVHGLQAALAAVDAGAVVKVCCQVFDCAIVAVLPKEKERHVEVEHRKAPEGVFTALACVHRTCMVVACYDAAITNVFGLKLLGHLSWHTQEQELLGHGNIRSCMSIFSTMCLGRHELPKMEGNFAQDAFVRVNKLFKQKQFSALSNAPCCKSHMHGKPQDARCLKSWSV